MHDSTKMVYLSPDLRSNALARPSRKNFSVYVVVRGFRFRPAATSIVLSHSQERV